MSKEYREKYLHQCDEMQGKKLLLHACCAPCSSATLEEVLQHFDVAVYFYNPNIQPKAEYDKRADELIRFVNEFAPGTPVIIEEYDDSEFERIAKGRENIPEKGERCYLCYEMRLTAAAKRAKACGFDCFTTTLSISPHKNADWLNEIGDRLAKEYNIPFISSDFKKNDGYKRSIALSADYGLYRQNYCGCKFSRKDK